MRLYLEPHIGDDWVWGCMFGGGWKLVPSGIKYMDVNLVLRLLVCSLG